MTSGWATRARRTAVVVLLLGNLALGLAIAVELEGVEGVGFFTAFAGIGALLVIRGAGGSVGWLLMLTGWGLGIGSTRVIAPIDVLQAGTADPVQAAAAWANACGWSFAFIGILGLLLVFPSGRLPTGRGRWPARFALAAVTVLGLLLATGPTITITPTGGGSALAVPNPIAIAPSASIWSSVPDTDTLFATMFVLVVGAIVGVIRRYRRSVGLVRLQYRWLVAAIAAVAVTTLVWAVIVVGLQIDSPLAWVAVSISYPSVPIAIAVAVLRYRLYDLDRLISRTIAYGSVIAVLAAVFGAAIVLLSSAFASVAEGRSIAVAGATLAAYAVFQPMVRRVRTVVDRRFDRTRYDADRTATLFSTRVRDETDVEAVTGDLVATAQAAVAPRASAVWLRAAGPSVTSR